MLSPAIAYTRIKMSSLGFAAKAGLTVAGLGALAYGARKAYDSLAPSVSRNIDDRYDDADRAGNDEGSSDEGQFDYITNASGEQERVRRPSR